MTCHVASLVNSFEIESAVSRAISTVEPFNKWNHASLSSCSFMSLTIAFQVCISAGLPYFIGVTSILCVWLASWPSWLIASREAGFKGWLLLVVVEQVEWALSFLTRPYLNSVFFDRATPKTIKTARHLESPPYKKPLNLFSLSYSRVVREKRLTGWLRPYRAAKTNAALERRDRLLRANLNRSAGSVFLYMCAVQFRGSLARLSKGNPLCFLLRLRSFSLSSAEDGGAHRY